MVSLRYLEVATLGALFMVIPVQSRLASPVMVKRLTPQYLGCYDSSQGLTKNDTNTYQSSGHCHTQCATGLDLPVMAMTLGSDCYCGQDMPPLSDKVADGNCSIPCQGFPDDNCGGNHYWAVWNSGLQVEVTNLPESSSSPSSTSTATTGTPPATPTASLPPSVVTIGGSTVVVTASTSSSSPASSNSGTNSGPNKAGIAAGVVVGIVAIAAAAGGIFLCIRAKRRKELEEEFMRQAAISSFVAGGKTGSSAGASHDTRLDPVIMTQRRMSDGSIADNEDYSRRILKVTNA